MSSEQSLAARRGIHLDAVTWIALGLVIAAILVFVTQRGVAARPTHRSLGPTSVSPPPMRSPTPDTTTKTLDVASPTATSTTTTTTPSAGQIVQRALSTTTTMAHTSAVTHAIDLTIDGRLEYPNDINSTYLLSTSGGSVSATLTWRGGSNLALSLRCNSVVLHRASAMGLIQLVLITSAANCLVQVMGGTETMSPAPYILNLIYPGATDANGN